MTTGDAAHLAWLVEAYLEYPLEDTKQVVEKVCFLGHRWSEGNKFKG